MGNISRLQLAALLTPLGLGGLYLMGTVALFFYGPIEWPVTRHSSIFTFLSFAFTLIGVGFLFGIVIKPTLATPEHTLPTAVSLGAVGNLILLFPAVYVYTGSLPWDFLWALGNQSAAYNKMQRILAEGMPFRSIVAALRAMLGPATVVLPALSVLLWGRMGAWMRTAAVAGLLSMCAFSIFRGTDKEIFDIVILQVAALGVVICRYAANREILPASRYAISVVVVLLVVSLILSGFVNRKAERVGFDLDQQVEAQGLSAPAFCMSSGTICSPSLSADISDAAVQGNFTLSMVTSYVSQGYYGLALVLEEPFLPMYGLGHTSLLTRAYSALTHDSAFEERAATARLASASWDTKYQWATAYAWFSNDVGVWGAALVVCGIAFLWGLSWKDALFGRNDRAAVVFCLLSSFFVYLPASNQIMQTADGYFALLFWTGIWLVPRINFVLRSRNRQGKAQ